MLYDGIIRFVQQARGAIEEHRIEDRFNLLVKASQVVMGLQACLDFEQGGDAARALYDFYSSIDTKLMEIHRTNSVEDCDAVIEDLKNMRSLWQEIDMGAAQEGTPQQALSNEAERASSNSNYTASA